MGDVVKRGMRRSVRRLGKTADRTASFLKAALTFREAERALSHVGWALIGGAVVGAALFPITSAAIPTAVGTLFLVTVLSMVCAIDARYGIIPDAFVIALLLGGLVMTPFANLPISIAGALAVLLAGYLLQRAYRALRGFDGLGSGDVKFLAAACLWVGPESVPWVLLIGVASALMTLGTLQIARQTMSRHDALPFGPHLAGGLWLVWLFKLLQP